MLPTESVGSAAGTVSQTTRGDANLAHELAVRGSLARGRVRIESVDVVTVAQ